MWLDGSTIGSFAKPNFSPGRTSNSDHQILTSTNNFNHQRLSADGILIPHLTASPDRYLPFYLRALAVQNILIPIMVRDVKKSRSLIITRQYHSMLLFLIFVAFSCKNSDKIQSPYIDRFYSSDSQLTELVKMLRTDSFLNGQSGTTFRPTQFNAPINSKLNKLGIDKVYYFSWDRNQRQFDLVTNWRKENLIHLTYNTLDTISTIKGFYKKDKNSNEFWGMGNSWTLWIERKLFEVDL